MNNLDDLRRLEASKTDIEAEIDDLTMINAKEVGAKLWQGKLAKADDILQKAFNHEDMGISGFYLMNETENGYVNKFIVLYSDETENEFKIPLEAETDEFDFSDTDFFADLDSYLQLDTEVEDFNDTSLSEFLQDEIKTFKNLTDGFIPTVNI